MKLRTLSANGHTHQCGEMLRRICSMLVIASLCELTVIPCIWHRPAAADYNFLIGNSGTGEVSVATEPTRYSEGELFIDSKDLAEQEREKGRAPDSIPPSIVQRESELTQQAIEEAARRGADELVRTVVHLNDVPFEFSQLDQDLTAGERSSLLDERRQALSTSQNAVNAVLLARGGQILGRYFVGENSVLALVPAADIPAIAALPSVRYLELDKIGGTPAFAYNLHSAAVGIRTDQFIYAGYDSNNNGTGIPVRIAILEHGGYNANGDCGINNYPVMSHVAWNDSASGSNNRIKKRYNCSGGSCVTTTIPGGGAGQHGHMVAGIAAQDIYDGQDPDYTTDSTRMQRSGIAQEADIYYYNIGCWYTGLRTAIDQAVVDNVDIINMSFGFDACVPAFNSSGVNEALAAALAAGIVPVAAVGNSSNSLSDACEISWPAYRPHVLGVTGLWTIDQSQDYLTTNVGIGISAMGGVTVTVPGSGSTAAAGVALAAPGVLRRMVDFSSGYHYSDKFGSSLATPVASGAAANLRDALAALGHSSVGNNGGLLLTNMLLMGDGSNGWNIGDPNYAHPKTKPNRRSGFGRLRMWWPSNSRLTAPWGWGSRAITVRQGETVTFPVWDSGPESGAITEWKWAVTWMGQNLTNYPDIDVSVYNTCPSGGGAPQLVASQSDEDFRNRIRLTSDDIAGRCLEMRITGRANIPTGGIVVYSADMFHSGSN